MRRSAMPRYRSCGSGIGAAVNAAERRAEEVVVEAAEEGKAAEAEAAEAELVKAAEAAEAARCARS